MKIGLLVSNIIFVDLKSLNSTFFKRANLSKTAIIYNNQSYTFLDLQKRVDQAVETLKSIGLTRGDLLVCWSDNHPRVLVQLLACEILQLKFMPIGLNSPRAEIDRLVVRFNKVFIQKNGKFVDVLVRRPQSTFRTLAGLVLRSSGSTGQSKVLIHSFSSVLQNAFLAAEFQGLSEQTRVLVSLSMAHTGGLNMQTLPCLSKGGAVILGSTNRDFFLASQRKNPTHTILVPSQVRWWMKNPEFVGGLSPSLKSVVTGSTPVTREDWSHLEAFFDEVTSVYGTSECGPFVFATRQFRAPLENTLSFLGQPISSYEYTLKDGEIGLKGPYRGETIDGAGDEFLFTGDIAKEAADGLYFVGRKERTLSVAGHKFAPEEVESALTSLSTVHDCVLIGKPHPIWGQIPIAVIDGSPETEKELREFCKKNIANYKCPRKFIFVKNFPRTEIEKIDYSQLSSFLDS